MSFIVNCALYLYTNSIKRLKLQIFFLPTEVEQEGKNATTKTLEKYRSVIFCNDRHLS